MERSRPINVCMFTSAESLTRLPRLPMVGGIQLFITALQHLLYVSLFYTPESLCQWVNKVSASLKRLHGLHVDSR